MQSIGFIGLGAMGAPMAENLVAAVPRQGLRHAARGGGELVASRRAWCGSAAEAAKGADALVLMVVNADQAEAVLFAAARSSAGARGHRHPDGDLRAGPHRGDGGGSKPAAAPSSMRRCRAASSAPPAARSRSWPGRQAVFEGRSRC